MCRSTGALHAKGFCSHHVRTCSQAIGRLPSAAELAQRSDLGDNYGIKELSPGGEERESANQPAQLAGECAWAFPAIGLDHRAHKHIKKVWDVQRGKRSTERAPPRREQRAPRTGQHLPCEGVPPAAGGELQSGGEA